MFTKKPLNLKSCGVIVLSVMLAAGAQAGDRHNKLITALDLSEEQTQQMKELHNDKRTQMKLHKEEKLAMKQGFIDLLDDYSEQKANALADKAADMARNKTLARVQQTQKVYQLLDDTQKQKFKKLMSERKYHHKGKKRAHMGHDE